MRETHVVKQDRVGDYLVSTSKLDNYGDDNEDLWEVMIFRVEPNGNQTSTVVQDRFLSESEALNSHEINIQDLQKGYIPPLFGEEDYGDDYEYEAWLEEGQLEARIEFLVDKFLEVRDKLGAKEISRDQAKSLIEKLLSDD